MKRTIILLLLVTQTLCSFGQSTRLIDNEYNNSGAIKLTFATTKKEAIEFAKTDIKKGTPFLLLQSGITPIVYATDSIFENKYNVLYYDGGCMGPDFKVMETYNFVIFNFLNNKYGKKWKRKVRKDVIGLMQWKREN